MSERERERERDFHKSLILKKMLSLDPEKKVRINVCTSVNHGKPSGILRLHIAVFLIKLHTVDRPKLK